MRNIAAAWACCGVVIVGAFFADLSHRHDGPAITPYTDAHIPGGGGQRPRGPEVDDEPDGKSIAEIGGFSDHAETIVNTSAESMTVAETAPGPTATSGHCRYIFRQSAVVRHFAAAKLAAAGASVAKLREAAQ